jgi:ABC-type sugar transport system permease subunit
MSPNIMRHVYGWLLLTPAAILLIAFTHYPTVATVFDSLFSKGTAIRPSRFVGLANYEMLIDDPIFWKVLTNNAWFAMGTIPTSIILAIFMALFVNRAIPGRSLVRMAYFTPTILPMIAVANIWLFFYTPDFGLIDQAASWLGFGIAGHNCDDDLEGGRILHDLLSGGAAEHPAGTGGGCSAGRRDTLVLFSQGFVPAFDADNVVRDDQRGA